MSPRVFLDKYRSLCLESGFCLTSLDTEHPLLLTNLDSDSSNADEVLDSIWVDTTLAFSFYE